MKLQSKRSFVKCNKCGEKYTDIMYSWCKLCQINNFKKKFTSWTSGNEKIDNFIQEKQLNSNFNKVFEWIPFNQFNNIINESDLATAIWKDGPLYYNKKWMRKSNENVALKYISQNVDELLNKV